MEQYARTREPRPNILANLTSSKAKVQRIAQTGSCTKNDSNEINSNGMTYDKNWMIANAVKKFL